MVRGLQLRGEPNTEQHWKEDLTGAGVGALRRLPPCRAEIQGRFEVGEQLGAGVLGPEPCREGQL